MIITVCIGSSCHIKGSHEVVEKLEELVAENQLSDKVTVCGTFCMGRCADGVCVTADGRVCSVAPETVNDFFESEVLAAL